MSFDLSALDAAISRNVEMLTAGSRAGRDLAHKQAEEHEHERRHELGRLTAQVRKLAARHRYQYAIDCLNFSLIKGRLPEKDRVAYAKQLHARGTLIKMQEAVDAFTYPKTKSESESESEEAETPNAGESSDPS